MQARGLVLIAKLIALAGEDLAPVGQPILPADARSIVLFLGTKDDRTSLDESALLDAVAIYTRDLGVTVLRSDERRRALGVPPTLPEISQLLRARNAALAFWCQTRADGRSVELVVTDGRRYTIRDAFGPESPAGPGIYRAIALKLRAALTGPGTPSPAATASRDEADRAPSQPLTPQSPPLATTGAGVAGPSGAEERGRAEEARGPTRPPVPPIVPVAATGGGRQTSPPRGPAETTSLSPPVAPSRGAAPDLPPPHHLSVAVDYVLSLPTGSTPWRNAAAFHGMASLPRGVEIDLGVELAPAAEGAVPSGSVAVSDIPLRLGARLLHRTNAYLIAAGALAGVHILFARATAAAPDRATESTRAAAGSFGLEVLARGPSIRGFAPELRLFGELNAPNTRFRVRGTTALEQGALTLGLCLGVVVPAP